MGIQTVRFGHAAQELPKFQGPFRSPALPASQDAFIQPLFAGRSLNQTERDTLRLINRYLRGIRPIIEPYYEASWKKSTQGPNYQETEDAPTNQDVVKKYLDQYINFHNDPAMEAEVNRLWAQRDQIQSQSLLRQLEALHDTYDGATRHVEFKKEVSNLSSDLQGIRASQGLTLDGRAISELELTDLRSSSTDPAQMKKLWDLNNSYGSYVIDEATGKTFAEGLLELFMKRNELADLANRDEFGDDTTRYIDAYTRSLREQKIDEAELVRLTDEVEEATREPYRRLLDALDDVAVDRFGIAKEEARQSWFQTSYGKYTNMGNLKRLIDFDPNKYFEDLDVEHALIETAALQGQRAQMEAILGNSVYTRHGETRSALYFDPEKDKGKRQGAFMTSGPNPPDGIRVFSSIDPARMRQMFDAIKTGMHETPGHGFDYAALSRRLPKLLREHHLTTTESHAFLHETLMTDREWLLKVPQTKDGRKLFNEKTVDEFLAKAVPFIQLSEISSIRATMAIMEFERQAYHHLYAEQKKGQAAKDPKALVQDLNDIWWATRERFMFEKRPAGEDAKKSGWAWLPHYIGSVAYYPNYFQADVLRAMKSKHIKQNFGTLLSAQARQWLNKYLKTGGLHPWNKIIEHMLGERLNARALKEEVSQVQIPQWKGRTDG